MKLHIVLRTHDGKNIHGKTKRYIDVSKKDLIVGCVSSLINSANRVNDSVFITVLDDHSTEDFLFSLKNILSKSNHPWEIINLKESGFNHSALMQFKYCRDSKAELIYSVEDDYLHCPTAVDEMLDAYKKLKIKYELNEVCIFPFDTPQEYFYGSREKFWIAREKNRHWRSSNWTTQTFMTSPKVLRDHWNYFEKLAKEFKVVSKKSIKSLCEDNIVWEETTIGNVWKNHVNVFHPIPSVALHVQFQKEKDPYIDHLEWWNKYTKIEKPLKFLYSS